MAQPITALAERFPQVRLQAVQDVVWQCIRHLFPPHARATPTASGGLAISWTLEDDPTHTQQAAPVVIQLEADYVRAVRSAAGAQCAELAQQADAAVRAGMRGYDPYARIPRSRVIVVG